MALVTLCMLGELGVTQHRRHHWRRPLYSLHVKGSLLVGHHQQIKPVVGPAVQYFSTVINLLFSTLSARCKLQKDQSSTQSYRHPCAEDANVLEPIRCDTSSGSMIPAFDCVWFIFSNFGWLAKVGCILDELIIKKNVQPHLIFEMAFPKYHPTRLSSNRRDHTRHTQPCWP